MRCEICGKEVTNTCSLSKHIKFAHNITFKEYYDAYLKKENEGICKKCHTNTTRFSGRLAKGYLAICDDCRDKAKQKTTHKLPSQKHAVICAICKRECDGLGGLNSHLKQHRLSSQEYYDIYLKQENDGKCIYCGQPTRFAGILTRYNKVCSSKKCISKAISDTKQNWTDEQRQQFLNRQNITNTKKYGTRCPANFENGKKAKATKIKHFGENYQQQITQKMIETKRCRYGTLLVNAWKKRRQNLEKFAIEYDCTPVSELLQKYGQGWLSLNLPKIYANKQNCFISNQYIHIIEQYASENHSKSYSKAEKEIVSFIQGFYNGIIIENTRKVITPQELDVYLPDLNLAIEYNGVNWHSITNGLPQDFHLNKSLRCRNLGIRLIHIYEFEDFEQQLKLLKDLILGIDNYPKNDYNKNNLLPCFEDVTPKKIYQTQHHILYGVGSLSGGRV